MNIQVDTWYILPNVLRPDDRKFDYRIKVLSVGKRRVRFETEPTMGWTTGSRLSLPLTSFRRMAKEIIPDAVEA